MINDGKPIKASDDDMAASYVVPTAVVNRFLVTTQPGRFRIAFGESYSLDHPINYRVAIQMTPWEAKELKDILETLLEPFQDEIDAIQKSLDDGSGTKE